MSKLKQFIDLNFKIHAPVFYPAAIIVLVFVLLTYIFGDRLESIFDTLKSSMTSNFAWLLVIAVNVFLFYSIYFIFSKFGSIRLGGQDAETEFSTFSWFAMLFSAGMGIGLLFFSVYEPVAHFQSPPFGEGGTKDSAIEGMGYTFLHWGMHAWGIYAVVGFALAFFAYNRKLPLTIRSIFYPLLGNRIYGFWGNLIDVIAVVADLFGLATSLGFGVMQIASGIAFLTGMEASLSFEIGLIAGITAAAVVSVATGIDKGVKFLSQMNLRLAAILLVLMLILGPTVFLLDSFIQNTGHYLQNIVSLGFLTTAYSNTTWQNDWSLFYWAWWISWSPFVGMFIARVSRGRTVREFFLGVLLVPSILTFLWMSVFGGSALHLELNGLGSVPVEAAGDVPRALFTMLDHYPLSFLTSIIAVILVIVFFVTSSDSGSLVVDSITSGGALDAPRGQRVFWATMEGAIAAALLLSGGLAALQTAAIVTGLPFAVLLTIMCFSLYKGLNKEYHELRNHEILKERESYKKTVSDIVTRRLGLGKKEQATHPDKDDKDHEK